MQKIKCSDLEAVQRIIALTGMNGEWRTDNNHCQFVGESRAVLNFWKSTGTITFQGPPKPANDLKALFLKRAIVIKKAR
jgi:hypothetical protein